MMVYWLHLILLFLFMKALWVEMTAVAPLNYSGKEAILEKQPSVKPAGAVYMQIHRSADSELYDAPLSSEDVDNESKLLAKVKKYNFEMEEGMSTENRDSVGLKAASIVVKRVDSRCDEFCEKLKRAKLDSNMPGIRAEDTSILSSSLESEQVRESKLAQRDISSTYESDNHNEDSKHLNGNDTYPEEVRFKTVKGIDPSPEEYVTPLLDVRPSVFPISVNEDQLSAQPTLNVSNNRTVGIHSTNTNTSESSVYNVHIDKGKVPNYNSDGFTPNGEKLSKSSSVNLKLPVKSNKNRTLQEIKPSPQIKYSEESKKKSFVKSLSDESGDNASLLQQSGISQSSEDSVLLMNDEPKNSTSQNKSHGAVFVPSAEEDNLEFPSHDINNITTGGVNASVFETNETFSTAAHGHMMKTFEESNLSIAVISGIAIGILVISSVIGAVSFVVYRRRYWNKPHTLSDKCSNADSSGYIDDSTLRDNSEEMYSLDNDSFLNSLEAMTIQNYWTDNVKHTKL